VEEKVGTDRNNKQVRLKDGRMLGYDEYGAPDGKPVFYFHGHPGSRLEWPGFDENDSAAELKARIIAVDRPGHGLSDFKRGRKLLDWPDDVIELADALQVDRFAVLGISGGGPYAAACAFKISGRLTATAIVCGMSPIEAPGAKEAIMLAFSPEERRQMLMGMAQGIDEVALVSGMKQSYPEGHPDRVAIDQPGVAPAIAQTWEEAFRSGIDGADQDAVLYGLPWGFQLQDITAEVHLWHGEPDVNVPVSAARYVADAIPNCRAKFFPDDGHISILCNHIREMLNALVA